MAPDAMNGPRACTKARVGVPIVSVRPLNPDFVDLARAFGAHGARPKTLDDFETAVAEALRADGSTLVDL